MCLIELYFLKGIDKTAQIPSFKVPSRIKKPTGGLINNIMVLKIK